MKELQRRQRMRKWLYSLPALAFLLVITGLLANGAWGVTQKQRASAEHVSELREKAGILSSRKAELEASIGSLETEEGILKEIKEKFSVSEEGEYVVVIVDEAEGIPSSEDSQDTWGEKWLESMRNLWQE